MQLGNIFCSMKNLSDKDEVILLKCLEVPTSVCIVLILIISSVYKSFTVYTHVISPKLHSPNCKSSIVNCSNLQFTY